MGTVKFNNPEEMILGGIGLLILGILLLRFGIGFIGAIFGIWWIVKGIQWKFQQGTSEKSYYDSKNMLKTYLRIIDHAISIKDYNKAADTSAKVSYEKNLKNEYRQQFVRDAALYYTLAGNLDKAHLCNNDVRFNNKKDPDYHNVNAFIKLNDGNIEAALDILKSVENLPYKGRFNNIVTKIFADTITY